MQVQRKRQRKPKVDGFWLQGEMTLGLCDLTHLSMRVGLYLMDLPEVNIFSIAGGRVRVSGAIAGDYLQESLAPGQANGTARLEPAASAVTRSHVSGPSNKNFGRTFFAHQCSRRFGFFSNLVPHRRPAHLVLHASVPSQLRVRSKPR